MILECLECNKSHGKYFNKNSVKRCAITDKFCDRDINKICLMLWKGVCLNKCMDSSQRFSETLLGKKEFYCNLIIEDIPFEDSKHAKKVWKDFQ